MAATDATTPAATRDPAVREDASDGGPTFGESGPLTADGAATSHGPTVSTGQTDHHPAPAAARRTRAARPPRA
jgi:hypothetical protein